MDPQINQLAFDMLKELHVAEQVAKRTTTGDIDKYVQDYLRYFDTVRNAIKGQPGPSRQFEVPGI